MTDNEWFHKVPKHILWSFIEGPSGAGLEWPGFDFGAEAL